jgi:hypothetical protein
VLPVFHCHEVWTFVQTKSRAPKSVPFLRQPGCLRETRGVPPPPRDGFGVFGKGYDRDLTLRSPRPSGRRPPPGDRSLRTPPARRPHVRSFTLTSCLVCARCLARRSPPDGTARIHCAHPPTTRVKTAHDAISPLWGPAGEPMQSFPRCARGHRGSIGVSLALIGTCPNECKMWA